MLKDVTALFRLHAHPLPRCVIVTKKLPNSQIWSLIIGLIPNWAPICNYGNTGREIRLIKQIPAEFQTFVRAALRFWEKGYRQRAASPRGRWHIAQMDVQHAPGKYYLHYEMSGIEYFALSLRWIQDDILSIRPRSLLLSFNASREVGHVLLEHVQ